MRGLFLLLLSSVCLFVAASAEAYEPPPSTARTEFQAALMKCQPYITRHKSPGEVAESDYLSYVGKRYRALAVGGYEGLLASGRGEATAA